MYNINLQQLFQTYDSNRGQLISYEEFKSLLRKMEPNLTENEVQVAFWKFDINKDL